MKLLFDQNISFRVAKKIQESFPETKHLTDLRIESYNDLEIWNYAKVNDFCLVTFDSDFIDISTLNGFPPKIIWLKLGNTSSNEIINKLESAKRLIIDFLADTDAAFLEIK